MTREQFETDVDQHYRALIKFVIKRNGPIGKLREVVPNRPLPSDELWPRTFPAYAKDAIQETLCEAWKDLLSFTGKSTFSTWLHAILRQTIRTLIKREQRQRLEWTLLLQCRRPDRYRVEPKASLSDLNGDVDLTSDVAYTAPDKQRTAGANIWNDQWLDDHSGEEVRLPGDLETSAERRAKETRERVFKAIVRSAIVPELPLVQEQDQWTLRRLEHEALDRAMSELDVPKEIQAAMWRFAGGAKWSEIAQENDYDPRMLGYEVSRWFAKLREHLTTALGERP